MSNEPWQLSLRDFRRLLRFRLRTFLIFVAIVCAWLGWQVHAARQQKASVLAIQDYGGWVYYDYQIVDGAFDPQARPWAPEWLRSRMGNDFFCSVVRVNLVYNDDGPNRLDNRHSSGEALQYVAKLPYVNLLLLKEGQASDNNLHYLKRLKRLRSLYMWDASEVSDKGIEQLRSLRNLGYVHCSNAKLTDESLRIFSTMPSITGLSLQENYFTDRGLAYLADNSNLTILWVGLGRTSFTDAGLKHLHGLKQLRQVEFQGSKATPAGVAELAAAIPGLKIETDTVAEVERNAGDSAIQVHALNSGQAPSDKPVD